jgi:hypothetical protein
VGRVEQPVGGAVRARQHPAAGDCEALRPGWLAQPVNALTSLGYLAAGVDLLARTRRSEGPAGVARLFAALLVANGLGGVAFHGPGDAPAKWLHDVSLTGTLSFMALHDLVVLARLRDRHHLAATAAALIGLGAGLAMRPGRVNHVSAMAGAAVGGFELAVLATGRAGGGSPERRARRRAAWLMAAATAVNLPTQTGAPWCRPGSLVQGHGAWHLLTAAALRAWARPLAG